MERIIHVFNSHEEADEHDLLEWLQLTGHERLRIGEGMREETYGDVQPGLQRLLRVAEQPRG